MKHPRLNYYTVIIQKEAAIHVMLERDLWDRLKKEVKKSKGRKIVYRFATQCVVPLAAESASFEKG